MVRSSVPVRSRSGSQVSEAADASSSPADTSSVSAVPMPSASRPHRSVPMPWPPMKTMR